MPELLYCAANNRFLGNTLKINFWFRLKFFQYSSDSYGCEKLGWLKTIACMPFIPPKYPFAGINDIQSGKSSSTRNPFYW